jgi:hypothetical protein
MPAHQPIHVFVSYSHEDRDMLAQLEVFLAQATRSGLINIWKDDGIKGGDIIRDKIMQNLNACQIFLCLVSPDYIASHYCYQIELEHAFNRVEAGESISVIPIILRPAGWAHDRRLRDRLALPTDGKPVSTWHNKDEAYLAIANELIRVANNMHATCNTSSATPTVAYLHLSRSGEEECCHRLEESGALIHIQGPADHGKSTTLRRLLLHAEAQGYRTALINLNGFDQRCFEDVQAFKLEFCAAAGKCLDVAPPSPSPDLRQGLGTGFVNRDVADYFELKLIPAGSSPLVVAVDAFDRINGIRELTNDICGLLRIWHEFSALPNSPWRMVRQILAYTKQPEVTLINRSPFNVGHTLRLQAFSRTELTILQALYGLALSADQLDELFAWLGGHPSLVTMGFRELARGSSFPAFLQQVADSGGVYQDCLRKVYRHAEDPRIAIALKSLCDSRRPVRFDTNTVNLLAKLDCMEIEGSFASLPLRLYRHHLAHFFAS